jgi:hypothetical protein
VPYAGERAERSRRGAERIRSLTTLAAAAAREEEALERRTFDPRGLGRLAAGVLGGSFGAYAVMWSGVWGRWVWSPMVGLAIGMLWVRLLTGAGGGNGNDDSDT